MRAHATLANVERELRATGAEVTIHALWVALANRAGQGDEPDVRVAGGWKAAARAAPLQLEPRA